MSIIQPSLHSGRLHPSTSSTRSPEALLTKEEYISKIPTIESIESESNYQEEAYYIQEEEQLCGQTG